MVLETNLNYCINNFYSSEAGFDYEQYGIVNYGFPEGSSGDFVNSISSSVTSPIEITNALPGSGIYAFVSGTTSEANLDLDITKTSWFLNDKINRKIAFRSFERGVLGKNNACSPELELENIKAFGQYIKASQKIGSFSKYYENWDSYGAKAIAKECIIMSAKILLNLIDLKFVPPPFIAPLSSGGMQMEWEQGERYLEISINPNSSNFEYLAVDHSRGGQLSLEGSSQTLILLKELVTWFINGKAEDLPHISCDENYEEWV